MNNSTLSEGRVFQHRELQAMLLLQSYLPELDLSELSRPESKSQSFRLNKKLKKLTKMQQEEVNDA